MKITLRSDLVEAIGIGLLYGIGGYFLVAVASWFLIQEFSSNQHDRSVEAAMMSAFFLGPMGGVIAFIVGVIRGRGDVAAPPAER